METKLKQDILTAAGSCSLIEQWTGLDLKPELFSLIIEGTGMTPEQISQLTGLQPEQPAPADTIREEFAWLDQQFDTHSNTDLLQRLSGNEKKPEGPAPLSKKAKELLTQLDNMTGLEAVKQQVHALTALMQMASIRKAKGLKPPLIARHMIFSGAPGTGKTTVARILASIMKELGILEKGHLVEASRQDLVAGHVGQTAIKTNELIDKAMGGMLFIDEAYSLYKPESANDFGKEAIETLLKRMEDDRDKFCVVAAGYPEPMDQFLEANPGLRSRFPLTIDFADYTPTELLTITDSLAKEQDYQLDDQAKQKLQTWFEGPKPKGFANGRTARTILENAIAAQALRLMEQQDFEDLTTLKAEDFHLQ